MSETESDLTRSLVAKVRVSTAKMLLADILSYREDNAAPPGDYGAWIKGFRNLVTNSDVILFCGDEARRLIAEYVWEMDEPLLQGD